MNLTIKKLSPSHLSLAKQFLKGWQLADGITDPSVPPDQYLINLLSKDSFHLIVAMDDELLVGGLTAFEIPTYFKEGAEMFLYEIEVIENYRQKGVAKYLVENLKEICTAKNIKIMYVGTEPNNLPAKQLYHRTGGVTEAVAWFTYNLDNNKGQDK